MDTAALAGLPAAHDPKAVALVFHGETVTYGALHRMAEEEAARLSTLDVGPGSKVAVCGPNSPDLVACLLGVWRLGAVVVDLNPALLPSERDAILDGSGAAVLVAAGPDGRLERHPLPLADEDPDEALTDVACINLTSGSTGRPKGVMLPARNLVVNADLYVRYFGLREEDRTCLFLPLFFGMNKIAVLAHLRIGATVVLEAGFLTPNDGLAAMDAAGCTGLCAVPAPLQTLLTRGDLDAYPVHSLRYVRIGAGRVEPALMARIERQWPQAEVFLTYGLTEVGLVTVHDRASYRERPDSVGRVIPEVEASIAPGEDGGEIVLRSAHAATGYYRDPDETAAVFRPDGLYTGDVGRLKEDFLYLEGRSKDLIKSGGENVSPREVEAVLLQHPAVAECAVVGVPDRWLGEAICAYVVVADGVALDAADLRRHCARYLTPLKRPARFVSLPSLPRNATGKVLKAALEDQNAARAGSTSNAEAPDSSS
jgi:acyl-CoA synthetase (AMP-forming)/AMP-acid ligase II